MKCLVTSWILMGSITGLPAQTQSHSALPREAGPIAVNRVNVSTLTGKVMCGYQGWFAVPSDSINRGWNHYKLGNTFAPGSCKFDLWPDMSEMESDEKHAAPGFYTASGAQAYVFSSQNRKTVVRHFKWMSDYGLDGVFIQRYANTVTKNEAGLLQFNNVLANCRAGAHQYGRVFAITYDLTELVAGDWKKLLSDWQTYIVQKNVLKDSCYLFHDGKPVVRIWGIGFRNRAYTLSECEELIDSLKNHPQYGGNTVMVGVPTHWRTLDQDAVSDSALHRIIMKADIVSPWFVGRPRTLEEVVTHTQTVVIPDIQWCRQNNKEYIPVAFPGFSWHNMKPESPLNSIPRLRGAFLWNQYYEYLRAGSTMLYQAMFDEIDEGTAIFKCTNDPPVGASTFVTYEGLPSDHYLWLVGEGGRMLRGETALSASIPERPSTNVKKQEMQLPHEFKLNQNYPNPFNPSTTIRYALPRRSNVDIEVFNMMGQKIASLVQDRQAAGEYRVLWNGGDSAGMQVVSGVYICRMRVWGDSEGEADGQLFTKKLVLVR